MVEDTGIGIPADKLDRIFDLYFTTKPEGSGIGLSIVYESHNCMVARSRFNPLKVEAQRLVCGCRSREILETWVRLQSRLQRAER